jgi:hypothetical protein
MGWETRGGEDWMKRKEQARAQAGGVPRFSGRFGREF